MLAILSDIHLCDGTAMGNVAPRAFSLMLDAVYDLARRYRARRLDLLLLGDIFDLVRTERWFIDRKGGEVPLAERPWGAAGRLDETTVPAVVVDRARAIAEEAIEANHAALALLRGDDPGGPAPPAGLAVRRIFLPGNHDRLYLHDEALRRVVRQALGAVDERDLGAEGVTQHRVLAPRYGLLARHGHEHDPWNFERLRDGAAPDDYTDEDYLPTPIGDVISTELISRLPFELRRRLADAPLFRDDPEVQARIVARMQRIQDVRPIVAAFRWLFFQIGRLGESLDAERAAALGDLVAATVRDVADDFHALEFVRAWHDRHDRLLRLDIADKLQLAVGLLRRFDVRTIASVVEELGGLLGTVDRHLSLGADAAADAAALAALPAGRRFVVYGHTHTPEQVPLRAEGGSEDLYVNSGTWRERSFRTLDKHGFISTELFTWLVFADRHETQADDGYPGGDRGAPAFIAWNGSRIV